MMVCSIANQSLGVWAVRRALHWPSLRPLLLGGLVGVPLGVYLLTHADPRLYERVIGLMLIAYCSWMLFRKPVGVRQTTTAGDLLVGSVAGVTGGFAGLAGVPTAIRVAMKGWDKDGQRALYQPLILILQVLALALVQGSRPLWAHGGGLEPQALFYLPGSLLGTWWGLTIFKRLSDRQFAISLNLLLILSGVTLVL
jgi:uncharacterized membrane protein YfcA